MPYYQADAFCPEQSLGYLTKRIHQLTLMILEPRFAEEGITPAQWSSLVVLYLGAANTPAGLAREVGYDKGAMTRLIDDLVTKGLVERERCNEDRRVIRLSLTSKGTEIGLKCKSWVIDLWNDWLEEFEPEEIDRTIAILLRLKLKLDKLAAETGA